MRGYLAVRDNQAVRLSPHPATSWEADMIDDTLERMAAALDRLVELAEKHDQMLCHPQFEYRPSLQARTLAHVSAEPQWVQEELPLPTERGD